VKGLRILIDIVRLAERDYLAKRVSWQHRLSAKVVLFGHPAFETLCERLGIDPAAAKLILICWKATGRVGDPVFGFLSKTESFEALQKGEPLPVPNFALLRQALGSDSLPRSSSGRRGAKAD